MQQKDLRLSGTRQKWFREAFFQAFPRLVWEKGLDVYADVIETLSREGVPHRSIIVGEGPAREMLEKRLPGTIFAGYRKGEDLSAAHASSDIFLFPSETETFGNVTLEAMASGVPTVCADALGSSALVDSGVTGYLAPTADSVAFTDYVRETPSAIWLYEPVNNAIRLGTVAVPTS